MSPTAAVTGATGFLGSHLCRRLLEEGWTVRGLCRPTSDRGALADRLEWHVGDVAGDAPLSDLVDGTDAVFHLAGIGLWSAGPETVREVNLEGTRSVVDACRGADAGRIVFTSTAGTRRAENGSIADESDVAEPIGAYQESKAAAEHVVDRYAAGGGDAVTVHPTSVFGPGDGAFTVQLLAMAADPKMVAHLPGGLCIVGVDDVVDGLLAAYRRGTAGEHYILGGENLTYREAVDRIAGAVGGTPARLEVPPRVIHAAGPVAEAVGTATGKRVFPFDGRMARLATERLFYTSRKAHEELGYGYEPIEEHAPDAMSWYRSTRDAPTAPSA